MDTRAGAPQGSVLGPLLWIVFYNDLLRLKIPGMTQVGFANDVVLIVTAETQNTVKYISNEALDMVVRYMEIRKVELGFAKTKALILYDPRKRNSVRFNITNIEIRPSKELKYLCIILDDKGKFGVHTRHATENVEKS
mgnify:FL=1